MVDNSMLNFLSLFRSILPLERMPIAPGWANGDCFGKVDEEMTALCFLSYRLLYYDQEL